MTWTPSCNRLVVRMLQPFRMAIRPRCLAPSYNRLALIFLTSARLDFNLKCSRESISITLFHLLITCVAWSKALRSILAVLSKITTLILKSLKWQSRGVVCCTRWIMTRLLVLGLTTASPRKQQVSAVFGSDLLCWTRQQSPFNLRVKWTARPISLLTCTSIQATQASKLMHEVNGAEHCS